MRTLQARMTVFDTTLLVVILMEHVNLKTILPQTALYSNSPLILIRIARQMRNVQ